MRIAFIKTGNEGGINRHILALLKHFKSRGAEVREFELREENAQEVVNSLLEFSPLFSMDINGMGIIVGQQEEKRVPICDIFGFVHVSIFTDEPLLYSLGLFDMRDANNFLPVVCDLKYADSLRFLGINRGVFYITPFIDKEAMIEPSGEKDWEVVFLGSVIDPQLIANQVVSGLKESFIPFFFEVGDFLFRNPEVPVLVASEYILSLFNQSIQEEIEAWRRENPQDYVRLLNDISIYATMQKRWYLLTFLEGINIKVLGEVQGELKEGQEAIPVESYEDYLSAVGRSYITILSFPHNLPSGIGFSPLEVAYMGSAPFIDYRMTLPGFLSPSQECIAYMPLDRADIEEKLLYYLENLEEAKEIGAIAREKVLQRYTYQDRGDFLLDLFNQIVEQSQKDSQ